ncbi:MAG: adenosylmethionine decarboxylase [Burkholderiales bacterium]|nr:adenosylmethionine decarboxylase [Burkholderiales bacterium]
MHGLQLTGDLSDCRCPRERLLDRDGLRRFCLDAVTGAGLTPVGDVFHRFDGAAGVTGAVLLAESHLAVHTWPERNAATFDIYVCNFGSDNAAKARALERLLIAHFAPERVDSHALTRGTAA